MSWSDIFIYRRTTEISWSVIPHFEQNNESYLDIDGVWYCTSVRSGKHENLSLYQKWVTVFDSSDSPWTQCTVYGLIPAASLVVFRDSSDTYSFSDADLTVSKGVIAVDPGPHIASHAPHEALAA